MRRINLFLLVCGLAAASLAQGVGAGTQQQHQQSPPDIVVYGFEWHTRHKTERRNDYGIERRGDYPRTDRLNQERRSRGRGVPGYDPQRLELPSSSDRPSQRVFNGYESSLQLKNAGTKTITAIEWEHVFFTDKDRQKELRRFRLKKRSKVGPGEQKFIAQGIDSLSYYRLPPAANQSVVINRIEYADGSVWQRY
ncbi:MAG TPA: hypothetical protein VGX92_07710 [Pyrinomonadaceae bacterium]|jgi:hypothetical protein|nr:hypothetical protein [Pyrinomonadaceae bacterium]